MGGTCYRYITGAEARTADDPRKKEDAAADPAADGTADAATADGPAGHAGTGYTGRGIRASFLQ